MEGGEEGLERDCVCVCVGLCRGYAKADDGATRPPQAFSGIAFTN